MNIEVGKSYRMRNGNKVSVVAVDASGHDDFPMRGIHPNGFASWWRRDGSYSHGDPSPKDIVAEWEDEPEAKEEIPGSLYGQYIPVDLKTSTEIVYPAKTLRDEIAIATATALISKAPFDMMFQTVADDAYKFADVMLQARQAQAVIAALAEVDNG